MVSRGDAFSFDADPSVLVVKLENRRAIGLFLTSIEIRIRLLRSQGLASCYSCPARVLYGGDTLVTAIRPDRQSYRWAANEH